MYYKFTYWPETKQFLKDKGTLVAWMNGYIVFVSKEIE